MPNHCSSILRIKGPAQDRAAFRAYARGSGPAWDGAVPKPEDELQLDLNQFVPVPPDVLGAKKNNQSNAYNSGGYEWCVANWGTKWGVYDTAVESLKDCLEYRFLTAWSPFEMPVLEAMAAKFPTLTFELKYGESGMGFGGIMTAYDGEGVEDSYFEDAFKIAKRDADFEYLMGSSG